MQTLEQHNIFRFYDRRTITAAKNQNDITNNFQDLLDSYFLNGEAQKRGLPDVAYFAKKLNLSANYFGDLMRKKTGKTPRQYIQNTIIDLAKCKIISTDQSINEIAYELGFTYPQHFMRLFKKHLNCTAMAYRINFKNVSAKELNLQKK
ncbi:helix-turn-helix domain-containing protein [Sphingobacterium sp. UT-1RO-CII-1]|uniref:helix-turn-helix domain-containing protein n=1 Tax=Sphingobacterium sp. UT-1RO-CII-1 TaxID=2995225 RepID=UPI00227B7796|nr:helix-turn-helix domain-containing protein [Sphingobacterium sp. UT-1RO-CII-1]MCY4778574.1 helix-turn-helix domain-containing protein [Sphingobacterium sp. UT-1RO-CII-1]